MLFSACPQPGPAGKGVNSMKIENVPFVVTTWPDVPPMEHKGETGMSYWKVFEQGNIRVRIVEFEPGFKADHYCPRGHVLLVLEGEVRIRLKDGKEYKLTPSMSFQASDDEANPHYVYSDKGGKVFIVD